MFFAQKIYFNNKPLVLTNDRQAYIKENPVAEGYNSFTGAFPRSFRLAFEHLGKLKTLGAIIEDISEKALQEELHALYEPIDAAGGVVLNEDKNVLLIYRRGKWDLPKGKRDDGEDIEVCALREVSEETGLTKLEIDHKIGDTYHVYAQGGQNLLKRTSWYVMSGTKTEQLIPQKEENILEARWVANGDLAPIMFNTYEAIKEVMMRAGIKW